ncbi:carbohydrate ABC transporter permease [Lederbergia citrea]|uniref:Carbohydrate ABC transporter permease n=1 Tax=Lederbergia citrea TaxID=2833581 RepID=A0A942Z5J7_9BACI|nr:carbohydrate ABC transporter permease [Lederbergia citrea]MBS4178460.1 carbohydrate ABC transporter permease [Lederbergia citrea]MBS4205132.1 carbohydrate ABC transporter permease [Lederbergia citrea]MBS4223006.1 carbohydrate ABC transporter permease [Lederbergia citrea]
MNEAKKKRYTIGDILTYVFLSILTIFSVFPFYWMFVIGSNQTNAINKFPPKMVPGMNFIENALKVFEKIDFLKSVFNSFVVSGLITLSVLFFCSLAGFAFAKLQFKGRKQLFIFVIATMMVPAQLGLIPMYMIISKLGWINSLNAVIVPGMVNAFGVFWMRQYISATIPNELIDAGRVDGCSNFRLYWNVTLPSIRPAMATLGLITFMNVWNDFLWPLVVLKDKSVHTIQIALRTLNGAYYQDYAMILAGTFMATLPILVVFLLFSKQFIAGLTEGAVKS